MTRPTLLLLPGTLCNSQLWHAQTAALAGKANIVVADLTQHDTITGLAQDALDGLPDGPFAMAGFSLGGYVAWEILRRAGDRVSALALINTSAQPESPTARAGREKMMALASTDFPRLTAMLRQFMLATAALANQSLSEGVLDMMNAVGADAYIRQSLAVMGRIDSRPTAAGVSCRTLVIAGADDKVAAPAMSSEIAQAIPSAKLCILPGTGHMAPLEQAGQVSVLMQAWLDQAAPTR